MTSICYFNDKISFYFIFFESFRDIAVEMHNIAPRANSQNLGFFRSSCHPKVKTVTCSENCNAIARRIAVFGRIVETDLRFTCHMNLIKDSRYSAMFSKDSVIFQGGGVLGSERRSEIAFSLVDGKFRE
jgi:hypothetical protein